MAFFPVFSAQHKTFPDMWHAIWVWCFLSCFVTYTVAALIAFCRLRGHTIGRFVPALIFVAGILFSITSGVLTSAVIALIYLSSLNVLPGNQALFCGVGQTILSVFIAFTRLLATL